MEVIEIAFVGYPVTDMKRARNFYEGVLGLKQSSIFEEGDKAWVEYDIGPGTLAIANGMPEWKPSTDGGAAALEVKDFNEAINQLRENSVPIVQGPFDTPMCNLAIILDPDGNALVIHKRKAG